MDKAFNYFANEVHACQKLNLRVILIHVSLIFVYVALNGDNENSIRAIGHQILLRTRTGTHKYWCE